MTSPADPTLEYPPAFQDRPHLPYLLPMLAFMLPMVPGQMFGTLFGIDFKQLWFHYLPLVYTVKTILAAACLFAFWRYYTPIRWRWLGVGFLVGLVGVPEWIYVEKLTQLLHIHELPKDLYIPSEQISNPTLRILFYVIRIGGPTLVVPVMEELFWRDFLMRALVRGGRFQEVEVGTFTWFSLLGAAAAFATVHFQWPSGFFYGLMMGVLLIRTKSIGACIVAHATTNLVLYLWVLCQGTHGYPAAFQFW